MNTANTPTLTLSKGMIVFFVWLHLMALLALAPFAFSWSAVFLMIFLHWLTASIGICFGFHRYLAHKGMELPKWLGYFIVFCGALACQNGPIKWIAHHRMHHGGSDTEKDPHNAAKGFWWAHFFWMINTHSEHDDPKVIRHYASDLYENAYYRFLENYFIHIQVAFGLILLAIGGIPWVIWGVFLRLVLVYHSTWFVNSAAHYFGYKNFKLENDLSTNCWWVGLLAYGEGWHNNHHALPQSARHGLRPWEIDMTWMAISFLRMLGLAKNIRVAVLEPEPDTSDTSDNSEEESFFKGRMVKQTA